jgi:hypothetical protein
LRRQGYRLSAPSIRVDIFRTDRYRLIAVDSG